jgi:hypothetical protein
MGHHDQLGHLAEAEAQDEARRVTAAVQKAGSGSVSSISTW